MRVSLCCGQLLKKHNQWTFFTMLRKGESGHVLTSSVGDSQWAPMSIIVAKEGSVLTWNNVLISVLLHVLLPISSLGGVGLLSAVFSRLPLQFLIILRHTHKKPNVSHVLLAQCLIFSYITFYLALVPFVLA